MKSDLQNTMSSLNMKQYGREFQNNDLKNAYGL